MARADSGQAAVEAALTLPLTVFLCLGTLQLFLAMQARVLAEYAVFRSVRVGSTNGGKCDPMMDAAVLALLPSFQSYLGAAGDPSSQLAAAFAKHGRANGYRYADQYATGTAATNFMGGNILLMERSYSKPVAAASELDFDQPGPPQRLSVRLVYWYPMRIPFANWVISKMVLGYSAVNPLMVTQTSAWPATNLGARQAAVQARAAAGELVLPVVADYSMRMMSPVEDGARTCGGT